MTLRKSIYSISVNIVIIKPYYKDRNNSIYISIKDIKNNISGPVE